MKLNEEQKKEIKASPKSHNTLAKEHGVSAATISKLKAADAGSAKQGVTLSYTESHIVIQIPIKQVGKHLLSSIF